MNKRRKNDFYPTPEWATQELIKALNIQGIVLEPCAGKNDITKILRKNKKITHVITNDIDPIKKTDYHLDASKDEIYRKLPISDWVITNPPFSCAIDIIQQCNTFHHSGGMAFLLRLSFLEPTMHRSIFLHEFPPNKLLILPRISFTGDGKTDSVTCAWMIWDQSGESWIKVVPK